MTVSYSGLGSKLFNAPVKLFRIGAVCAAPIVAESVEKCFEFPDSGGKEVSQIARDCRKAS